MKLARLSEQGEPFSLTFTVGLPLWGRGVEIDGAEGVLLRAHRERLRLPCPPCRKRQPRRCACRMRKW
ncbi:MAG UNVERIFIED_CONTAM: hypothetical protein LVT10_14225 [Anaerolineae bacterium]